MQRIMIIGQPGAGKSTLARALGEIAHLPVFHIDRIHWQSGWVEREGVEKDRLCRIVHARSHWIFEGGRSTTWPERLARADTLIWLDVPLATRYWRVMMRTLRYLGRNRTDLPQGCPDRFNRDFFGYLWTTRHSSRAKMRALYELAQADSSKCAYRLATRKQTTLWLANLRRAAASGNLGISHR